MKNSKMKNLILIVTIVLFTIAKAKAQFFQKHFLITGASASTNMNNMFVLNSNKILFWMGDYYLLTDSLFNITKSIKLNTINTPSSNDKVGIIKVKDGYIVSESSTYYSFSTDFYKFDTTFTNVIWYKSYYDIINTSQNSNFKNHLVRKGTSNAFSYISPSYTQNSGYVITNFDSLGNLVNSKILNSSSLYNVYSDNVYFNNMLYIISNNFNGIAQPYNSFSIVKTNTNSLPISCFKLKLSDSVTFANKIIKTSDNKLLISGYTIFAGSGGKAYPFILKCDTSGAVFFSKVYQMTGFNIYSSCDLVEINNKYLMTYVIANPLANYIGGILSVSNTNGQYISNKDYRVFNGLSSAPIKIMKYKNSLLVSTTGNFFAKPTFIKTDENINLNSCNIYTSLITAIGNTPTLTTIASSMVSNYSYAVAPNFLPPTYNFSSVVSSINEPCNLTTSFYKINNFNNCNVSPIPTNGILHIDSSEELLEISIINLSGQTFITKKGVLGKIENLDLSELSSGIYFLQIKSEDSFITKKVIKY